jgi:hypothetical protein
MLLAVVENRRGARRNGWIVVHSGKPQTVSEGLRELADLLIGRRFVNLPHKIVAAREDANGQ